MNKIDMNTDEARRVLRDINFVIDHDLHVGSEMLQHTNIDLDTVWKSRSHDEFQRIMDVQLEMIKAKLAEIKQLRDDLENEIYKWEEVARRLGI